VDDFELEQYKLVLSSTIQMKSDVACTGHCREKERCRCDGRAQLQLGSPPQSLDQLTDGFAYEKSTKEPVSLISQDICDSK
jgi:hypothetical protein